MSLRDYGCTDDIMHAFLALDNQKLHLGRITTAHRGTYEVYTETGEVVAEIPGRMRFRAKSPKDLPTVGDWVGLTHEETPQIMEILPRRTVFMRKEPGKATREQVIAANVDHVFIVSSMNMDFSPRRIERYLALVHESGARPVIVLSKADLASKPDEFMQGWNVPDAPVHQTSAVTGLGLDDLRKYMVDNNTIAFVGSSGVGKSTLINVLIGHERQEVRDIRDDGKGRHTTTRRELIIVPPAGVVLDTPGMRELQLWDSQEGIADTFDDIREMALKCKFTNCFHKTEPGCSVLRAVLDGDLPQHRLDTFHTFNLESAVVRSRTEEKSRSEGARDSKEAEREFLRTKRGKS